MHEAVRLLRPRGTVRYVTEKSIRHDVYYASGHTTLDDVNRFAASQGLSIQLGGAYSNVFGPATSWPEGHIASNFSVEDVIVIGDSREFGGIELRFHKKDGTFSIRILK